LRHLRSENERVAAFVEALECCDLQAAGDLLTQSHESLRTDYEVSTPELDALVETACAAGAYGARLVGGGFGGSVLALVDRDRAEGPVAEPSRGAEVRPRGTRSAVRLPTA
jgi:galactokinase